MLSRKILQGFVAALAAITLVIPSFTFAANEGDVIKAACSEGAGSDDACWSVYYLGRDGRRHFFPNEDVYRTWFDDFDNVVEISRSEMDNYPVGKNVTIKPGSRLVKFQTSDAIYAVSEGGVLHHYLQPLLVVADYGRDWAAQYLVVLPDTFYSDYRLGDEIDSSLDYDREDAADAVSSLDDNF